jgi:hypothetical protein
MALTNLKEIYKDRGRNFIENLFTKYVIVSEQLDGSRFTAMRNSNGVLIYCKKDGSPINMIDRTMMVFYETAIQHFEELDTEAALKMPDNWVFGFQYFPSTAPVNIVYDRLPKNNLILTDIQITNGQGRVLKTISDPRVLKDWSKILDVEGPPIIYSGFLEQYQKDKILDYLSTPEANLMALFKSQSFTRYIISILNHSLRTSALMNDIDKPIEGIVFKFITPGESEVYSARLIDPIFHQHSMNVTKPIDRKANDMYQIAMLDIIEFMELVDMNEITLVSESPDERYIELMCILFNDYIKENGHKYIGVDFETPDFAKKPEFELNLTSIPNARTQELLKNTKLNDLFKIIISSFRRYRKNATPILTQQIINTLNGIVDKIQKKVEMVPEENTVMDFNNYLKRSQIENVASIFEKRMSSNIDRVHEDNGFKTFNSFIGETIKIEEPLTLITEAKKIGKFSRKAIIDYLLDTYSKKYTKHSSSDRINGIGTGIEDLQKDVQSMAVNNGAEINNIEIVDPFRISSNTGIQYSKQFSTLEFEIDGTLYYLTLAEPGKRGPSTEEQESASIYVFEKAIKNGDKLVANYIDELQELFPSVATDPSWLNSLQAQVDVLITYMAGANTKGYSFFRDSDFTNKLYSHAKSIGGFKSKDSWQPADVWIVKDPSTSIKEILSLETIEQINAYLSAKIKLKEILPISLKKTKGSASISELNIEESSHSINDKISSIDISFAYDSKSEKFKNAGGVIATIEGVKLSFRYSSKTQFAIEAMQRGAVAQLGKVPAYIYRKYIGSDLTADKWIKGDFEEGAENWNAIKTYFEYLSNNRYVNCGNKNWEDFAEGMSQLYKNKTLRGLLFAQKAIAMEAMYNILNSKDPDNLVNILISASQKMGSDNGPFIKIY